MAVIKPEIVGQEDQQETVESIKIVLSLWLKSTSTMSWNARGLEIQEAAKNGGL